MFNYISEILKNFGPAQRIMALLILLFSIIIITLGPSIIDAKTDTCDELRLRIKSQQEQIVDLNARVDELNKELLTGQKECTDNLIAKQREIMNIVNGMIADAERADNQQIVRVNPEKKMMVKPTHNNGNTLDTAVMATQTKVVVIKNNNNEMIKQLKTLKKKVESNLIN